MRYISLSCTSACVSVVSYPLPELIPHPSELGPCRTWNWVDFARLEGLNVPPKGVEIAWRMRQRSDRAAV